MYDIRPHLFIRDAKNVAKDPPITSTSGSHQQAVPINKQFPSTSSSHQQAVLRMPEMMETSSH